MIIVEWLVPAMKKLAEAGVDSPRRDCLVLIEDLLQKDRSWVTAHAETTLDKTQIKKLDALIKQRADREPLAYIRKKAWFYDRLFAVTPDVLIPRPESESFIEILKEIKSKSIADIGTGSGCLAITAKLELPQAKITAIDIDEEALKVAQKNAKIHKTDINFIHGSLLEQLNDTAETIIANLPYVPANLITSPEIIREPKTALFSGEDGLDHYREFWKQVKALPKKPAYILTESLENQHKELIALAIPPGYKLIKTEVLVQLFRRS